MLKTRFLVTVIVLFLFSFAVQATVFWGEPNGSNDYFEWTNGGSEYGLFGDPIPVGNDTFVFSPSMFRAESLDRQTDSISDILTFELVARPGLIFKNISITEYGDFGILGNGLVQASGSLSVENLDTTDALSSGLTTDLPSNFPDDTFGQWQALSEINIAQMNWTHIRITLENNLFAISGVDSVAWIEKKVLGTAIALQVVPEPFSSAIFALGLLYLTSNRKKPI